MIFSCFCSNKKYMESNVLLPRNLESEKLVIEGKNLWLIDAKNNTLVHEVVFEADIVTTAMTKAYILACTAKTIYLIDQLEFMEVKKIDVDDIIVSSTSEKIHPYFYIGCKSGTILVYSVRKLPEKLIVHEVYKYNCFRPIYNIAVEIEKKEGGIRRKVFAGFSRWGNQALELVTV